MYEEDERCEKALQQCARNIVDGIVQFVSSEKEHYKFIIIACKETTNMIVELVCSWYFLLITCKVTFFPYIMCIFLGQGKSDLVSFVRDGSVFHWVYFH